MPRLRASLLLLCLSALSFGEGPGLVPLTKFAPGVVPTGETYLQSLDLGRKTALLSSTATDVWKTQTWRTHYYLLSFEGRTLERVPIERLSPWVSTSFRPNLTTATLATDGKAVIVGVSPSAFEVYDYHVYNRQSRSFYAPFLTKGLKPFDVRGGKLLYAQKGSDTVKVDLATGEQTLLSSRPYDYVSPDGKTLYRMALPNASTEGTLYAYRVGASKETAIRVRGTQQGFSTWFSPDRKTLLSIATPDGTAPKLVKTDLATGVETEYPMPDALAVYSPPQDMLGDTVLMTGSDGIPRAWNLATGELKPVFKSFQPAFVASRFLDAGTALVNTHLPLSSGDTNGVPDVGIGPIGSKEWTSALTPRASFRSGLSALSPDDRAAVTVFAAMGNEAGGQAYGFVRRDLATGAIEKLSGRPTMPTALLVSNEGKTALLVESTSPPKIAVRDLATGSETDVPLGESQLLAYDLSPKGDEAMVAIIQGETPHLLRWTQAGVAEVPLPAGVKWIRSLSLASGSVGFTGWTDAAPVAYSGPTTGTAWKPLALSGAVSEGVVTSLDGSTVAVQLGQIRVPKTRLYRARTGGALRTLPYGELSRDGNWLFEGDAVNSRLLYVPTGAIADTRPPRAESDAVVEFVGPWMRLRNPAVWNEYLPLAYRATVLRAPELSLSPTIKAGGVVEVVAEVMKAGLENAGHTVTYRIDGGEWKQMTNDRFAATLPHGPHRIEAYVEDTKGRRSPTVVSDVVADATGPAITDVRHVVESGVVTISLKIAEPGKVEIALARATGNYKWTRAVEGFDSYYAKFAVTSRAAYKYRIRATDEHGNVSETADSKFTTP